MENAVAETTSANVSAAQRVARGAMAANVGIWGLTRFVTSINNEFYGGLYQAP